MGQGLDGLAEAHVVGQDAAEAVFAQELHPRQAGALVGAQLGMQARRHLDLAHALEGVQLASQFAQALAAHPAHLRRLLQLGQARGVQLGQAQRAFQVFAEIQFAQRGEDRLDALRRQGHAHIAGQVDDQIVPVVPGGQRRGIEMLRLPADHLDQQRQQGVALAFDQDAQFEREPVAGVFQALFQLGIPFLRIDHVVAVLAAHFEYPAGFAQARQLVAGEGQPGRFGRQLQQPILVGQGRVDRRRPEAERGQGFEGGAFGRRVAFDRLDRVAGHAAQYGCVDVEKELAVVVEAHLRIVVVLEAGVSPAFIAVQQHGRDGNDVAAHTLLQYLRHRQDMLQALPAQRRRHGRTFVQMQYGRLGDRLRQGFRLQRRQMRRQEQPAQRHLAILIEVQVAQRFGRQDVVDVHAVVEAPAQRDGLAAAVGRLPAERGPAFRPGHDGNEGLELDVVRRGGEQQPAFRTQALQQDGAERTGRRRVVVPARPHCHQQAHQPVVAVPHPGRRACQQIAQIILEGNGGDAPVLSRARLARTQFQHAVTLVGDQQEGQPEFRCRGPGRRRLGQHGGQLAQPEFGRGGQAACIFRRFVFFVEDHRHQQRRHHVLAIEGHRATAIALDAHAVAAFRQADRLDINGAAAARHFGIQAVAVGAQAEHLALARVFLAAGKGARIEMTADILDCQVHVHVHEEDGTGCDYGRSFPPALKLDHGGRRAVPGRGRVPCRHRHRHPHLRRHHRRPCRRRLRSCRAPRRPAPGSVPAAESHAGRNRPQVERLADEVAQRDHQFGRVDRAPGRHVAGGLAARRQCSSVPSSRMSASAASTASRMRRAVGIRCAPRPALKSGRGRPRAARANGSGRPSARP
jgi:hypothetical protein